MDKPNRLFAWEDKNASTKIFYTDNESIFVETPLYNNQGVDSGKKIGYVNANNTFDLAVTLTVNTTPSDATVTFNTGTSSGKKCTVPHNTTIKYTVSKTGYKTSEEQTVEMGIDDKTVTAPELEKDLLKFTIIPTPSDATVVLTAAGYTQVGNSIEVPYGSTVDYTVSAEGCTTKTGTITVTEEKDLEVKLEIPLTLVYSKTDGGNYSYDVPEKYNYIKVELAGAAGQQAMTLGTGASTPTWQGVVGNGAIKTQIFNIDTNRTVNGIIGVQPTKEFNKSQHGGTGYQSGANGTLDTGTGQYAVGGGGGGGSSSVNYNNTIITAGGGSGCGLGLSGWFNCTGGAGGGPNGGATASGTPSSSGATYNGNNATDPDATGLNNSNGYVKIYAGYKE